MAVPARIPRQDSRRHLLLDVAAALFAARGYAATSMRDIAKAAGMLPGSIYCHFPTKAVLLRAVYEEGVRRIGDGVARAVAAEAEPWARLRAAASAHMAAVLDDSSYARVVIRVLPADAPEVAPDLTALRDGYEDTFRRLIDALALPAAADAGAFRRLLLGALNWSQTWYRPGGDAPAAIAGRFVDLLRADLAAGAAP